MNCPSDDVLTDIAIGLDGAGDVVSQHEHLAACPTCRERVAQLQRLSSELAAAHRLFHADHDRMRAELLAALKKRPPDGGLSLPAETKRMSANRGIEAVAPIRAGRLKGTTVLFSERLPDKNGNLRGWLIGGPTPGAIALRNVGGFDITDAAALPDGGIVVLERRFRYSEGVKMRIRRIAAKDLKPGALLSGKVLLEANDSLNIDNMEGIAAHRAASGETILTLISDDNFSALQRTLLMQFALPDTGSKLAEPTGH